MLEAGVAAVLCNQVCENCMASCVHEAEARAGLVTWEGARDSQRALRALLHLGKALSTFVGSTNPVTWLNT